MTKQRILFFGNERLSSSTEPSKTPVLRHLIANDYNIAAVIVTNKPTRSRKQRPLEVAVLAEEQGIPVVYVDKPLKHMVDQLKEYNATAAILVAFGKIIPQSVIDIFEHGIINIHPSDLPEHRGSTPIESTILSGQTKTAISIMQLDAGMDTGPVFIRSEIALNGTEEKTALTQRLAQQSAELLIASLPQIVSGKLAPTDQDHSKATYTNQLQKSDGIINWTKPAVQIEREVRAYSGWPGSTTTFKDISATIHKTEVLELSGEPGQPFSHDKQLAVYCGKNALLIHTIQPSGKKPMDSKSFLNGFGRILD